MPRRPLARAAARALPTALAAALLAGLATACTSDGSGSAEGPPSQRQIASLLAAHGRAVGDRDAAAFDAALATGKRSAAFGTRQRAAFANLAEVPLAGWSYSFGAPAGDRDAARAASRRYGTPAVIVRVSLAYRLRGIDTVPSRHDLWWTFIRQDGSVRIAGDGDLAAAGSASWRGPWDFGTLRTVRGARTLVLAHSTASGAALRALAAGVDAAVPAVSAVWGSGWARRVAVLVPASAGELAADAGSSGADAGTASTAGAQPGDEPAALAVSDTSADADAGATAGPGDADAPPPGQRLIVNPDAFGRLSALGRRIVLRHEVTHLAAAGATSVATPRWIVEGFAEYVANLGTGQPVPTAAAELRAAVRAHGAPAALPADSELADPATAAAAYQGAWLACRLIAARAGQAGLVRFYRAAAGTAVTGDPVTGALRTTLRATPAAFTVQWRRYLVRELRA